MLDGTYPQGEGQAGTKDGKAENGFPDIPTKIYRRVESVEPFQKENRCEIGAAYDELVHCYDLRFVASGEPLGAGCLTDFRQYCDDKQDDSQDEVAAHLGRIEGHQHYPSYANQNSGYVGETHFFLEEQRSGEKSHYGSGCNYHCGIGGGFGKGYPVCLAGEIYQGLAHSQKKEFVKVLLVDADVNPERQVQDEQNGSCEQDSDENKVFDGNALAQELVAPDVGESPQYHCSG